MGAGIHSESVVYDADVIEHRSRVIGYAIDARKQRFPEENFTRAHEIEQYVRNRKNSSTGGTGLEQGRYSVVTDFTKASTKRGRFEVTTEIAAESLANSPSIENQKPETSETITDSSPDTR